MLVVVVFPTNLYFQATTSTPAVNGEVPPKKMTKAEKKIFYGMNSPEEVAYKILTEVGKFSTFWKK